MSWDARFCFVAFEDLEQEEDGDTLTHTFIWTGWEICQTRYFYFWAQSMGEAMKSTSCIFSKHYPPGEITFTFYPDKHPETKSVDGHVDERNGDYDWADLHGGPGEHAADDEGAGNVYAGCGFGSDKYNRIERLILLFDTSILLPGWSVIQATLSPVLQQFATPPGWNLAINVYTSNPASNIALVPGDYATLGSTPLSTTKYYPALFTKKRYDFPLNPAGKAAIVKGGITKLGLREATYDAANIPPPWLRFSGGGIRCWMADDLEGNKPKLTVTVKTR